MTRKMLYTLIALLILLSGCATGEFASHYVGPYNRPNNSPDYKAYDKWVGHHGRDIDNPTESDMETYCDICHYIYMR